MRDIETPLMEHWDGFCRIIYCGAPLYGFIQPSVKFHPQFFLLDVPESRDLSRSHTRFLNLDLVAEVTPLSLAVVLDHLFPEKQPPVVGKRRRAAAGRRIVPVQGRT